MKPLALGSVSDLRTTLRLLPEEVVSDLVLAFDPHVRGVYSIAPVAACMRNSLCRLLGSTEKDESKAESLQVCAYHFRVALDADRTAECPISTQGITTRGLQTR
jgi:hypothetical protein